MGCDALFLRLGFANNGARNGDFEGTMRGRMFTSEPTGENWSVATLRFKGFSAQGRLKMKLASLVAIWPGRADEAAALRREGRSNRICLSSTRASLNKCAGDSRGAADRQTGRRIVEQNPSPSRSSNVLLLRWEGSGVCNNHESSQITSCGRKSRNTAAANWRG